MSSAFVPDTASSRTMQAAYAQAPRLPVEEPLDELRLYRLIKQAPC